MSIARDVLDRLTAYRNMDSMRYTAREDMLMKRATFMQRFDMLFANLPGRLAQFMPERLFVEGMMFLYINLAKELGNAYDSNEVTEMTLIVINKVDGELVGLDASGKRYALGSPADDWTTSHNRDATLRDLMKNANMWKWKALFLPLRVPETLKHHTILQNLVSAANRIAGDDNNELAAYTTSQHVYRLADEQTGLAYKQLGAFCEGLAQPLAVSEELIREIKTMDWSFDYADRPSSASYDQKRRILKGLASMTIDDAAAVIGKYSRGNTLALNYLMNHPDYPRIKPGVRMAA